MLRTECDTIKSSKFISDFSLFNVALPASTVVKDCYFLLLEEVDPFCSLLMQVDAPEMNRLNTK